MICLNVKWIVKLRIKSTCAELIRINREDWFNTLCNDLISYREMIQIISDLVQSCHQITLSHFKTYRINCHFYESFHFMTIHSTCVVFLVVTAAHRFRDPQLEGKEGAMRDDRGEGRTSFPNMLKEILTMWKIVLQGEGTQIVLQRRNEQHHEDTIILVPSILDFAFWKSWFILW